MAVTDTNQPAREAVVYVLQEWVADRQPRTTVFELADRIMKALTNEGFDPSAPAGFGDKRAAPGGMMDDTSGKRGAAIGPDSDFQFGRAKLNERGFRCCGKPKGCTNMNPGCAYLQHPYKRWVRGEITLAQLEGQG